MGIFSEIFSWWGGNTWGTRLTIARQGRFVGSDSFGNRYYEQIKGVGPEGPLGRQRRWVTYTKLADPSKVPPEWHGWLHYTVDTPPTEERYVAKPWQKPHQPNMTGTPEAYRPQGSILGMGHRPKATGDYKPWRPE
ncbi:NADH:ubiquinone oxidoreductase subunit NDUFA12 [Hyphomicrobium sp.]|uniref:NADH:ubiquinone oxidoreductase subunit NDUFA12 n=1 Tax=Hyphomicrobium sp. TaxID=82 RepID=UPI002E379DE0|nr:NADH:ubiquinone oxidoreductase subunit NDUFA12 [Hyphomicrobium sp.]HEX2842651.1 NADH:ubiquinone oxidoreductase subunit NDUFA12 [Hyphomicrobium sp.]